MLPNANIQGTTGMIPIEVYTVDNNDAMLEAIIFNEHITPITYT